MTKGGSSDTLKISPISARKSLPMSRLPQVVQDVASALQYILQDVAEAAAVRSGWCQRQRKLSGATLMQALTLGFLAQPQATRSQLAQAAACAGVKISPQGLTKRLNEKAALLMQQVLEAAGIGGSRYWRQQVLEAAGIGGGGGAVALRAGGACAAFATLQQRAGAR
jgi:hypothetical protein